jgi:hypothetical protein
LHLLSQGSVFHAFLANNSRQIDASDPLNWVAI